MSSPRILVEDLSVRLGEAEVLHEVSMTVGVGEFLTVIGPNGAGKSTLLRCLDGILAPSHGRVLIDGRPIDELDRRQLARTVSYVPQPDAGPLDYTVRSFVEMGRYPHVGAWAALTEADVDAVKLEGGKRVIGKIRAILDAGIVVIGHIGLTPQSSGQLGGHKAQGRTADSARLLIEDALMIHDAGAHMLLLEAVPPEVAAFITKRALENKTVRGVICEIELPQVIGPVAITDLALQCLVQRGHQPSHPRLVLIFRMRPGA